MWKTPILLGIFTFNDGKPHTRQSIFNRIGTSLMNEPRVFVHVEPVSKQSLKDMAHINTISDEDRIMTMTLIPLKDLTSLENVKLFSQLPAQSIDSIKHSIAEDGLLNPLVVIKQNSRYQVIDGKKRLIAIRQLAKLRKKRGGRNKVPCVIQETRENTFSQPRRPLLLSGPELAHAVITEIDKGLSPVMTAQRFECELSVVNDIISLRNLHPTMLKHFNSKAITLEQASAFATFQNPDAQLRLLLQLGPFVSDQKILSAIKAGKAVIEFPDGNVMFLPSREFMPKHKSVKQNIQTNNIIEIYAAA